MEHRKNPGEQQNAEMKQLSVKLPIRVKSGSLNDESIQIISNCDDKTIAWGAISYICLGCIEESVGGADSPKSNIRNVVRKLLFGEKEDKGKKQTRLQYILDIYVDNHEAAYRFDSININYKSFLGEVSYISFHNFKRLFQAIVDHAQDSYFNRSAVALMKKKPERIHRYNSVYDFELDCQNARAHLETEVHWNDIGGDGEIGAHELGDSVEGLPEDRYRVIDGVLDDSIGEKDE